MTTTSVAFIQGAGEGAREADSRLADRLRTHLGEDFAVIHPAMPRETDPDYAQWKATIAHVLADMPAPRIIVAHSVGATTVVRMLLDTALPPLAGVFLLAPPYLGEGGWKIDGIDLKTELSSARFREQIETVPVFIYHCRDDAIVPFAHQALYSNVLPHATARAFETGGHQFADDMETVARDVVRLTD